LLNL
jgi:hypothetical protein